MATIGTVTTLNALPLTFKDLFGTVSLIEKRTDKREVNYSETYNEETGDLSLDYLAKLIDEQDPGIDELVFTPKLVSQAKEAYANMPNDKKKEFLKLYESLKSTLPENMSTLLSEVVGEDTSADIKSARNLRQVLQR